MPLDEDEYMNESISVAAKKASAASDGASFFAALTSASDLGPCAPQNFFASGVSTVPSSTMILPFVSIRIAQLSASAALSCIAAPPAAS
jgi:hypothetical protein